jgi:hypothetical protein
MTAMATSFIFLFLEYFLVLRKTVMYIENVTKTYVDFISYRIYGLSA